MPLCAQANMERHQKSFKVAILAPTVPQFTEEQWRTLRVQVAREYLPFRDHSDLLSVLTKASVEDSVRQAILGVLHNWAMSRESIDVPASTDDLSAEQQGYFASIEPTWESLKHRSSVDLALLIFHLLDAGLIKMEADKGFCVAGELKRIDFVKSDARKKLRSKK